MFTSQQGTASECPAVIETLSKEQATFFLDDPSIRFPTDTNILLNFTAEDKTFALGGLITNVIDLSPKRQLYNIEFKTISEEDNLAIIKFLRDTENKNIPEEVTTFDE